MGLEFKELIFTKRDKIFTVNLVYDKRVHIGTFINVQKGIHFYLFCFSPNHSYIKYLNPSKLKMNILNNKNGKKKKYEIPVDQWTSNQFAQYIGDKYKKAYGVFNPEMQGSKGMLWNRIKKDLLGVFKRSGMKHKDIVEYIDWAYEKKYSDMPYPITIPVLCQTYLMAEWVVYKNNKLPSKNKMEIVF